MGAVVDAVHECCGQEEHPELPVLEAAHPPHNQTVHTSTLADLNMMSSCRHSPSHASHAASMYEKMADEKGFEMQKGNVPAGCHHLPPTPPSDTKLFMFGSDSSKH